MSRLLMINLFNKIPSSRCVVVNRSLSKAQELIDDMSRCEPNAELSIAGMDDLWNVVGQSDVVFTATSSSNPIITPPILSAAQLRRLMLIDISVPRNVAAECGEMENVFSY